MGYIAYTKPGKYVAICNNTNFDGHYVKVFEKPDNPIYNDRAASWYFLNRVDAVACLEAVYPLEMFSGSDGKGLSAAVGIPKRLWDEYGRYLEKAEQGLAEETKAGDLEQERYWEGYWCGVDAMGASLRALDDELRYG